MIPNRISFIRKKMSSSGIDTFLILSQENRRYLSGFTGEDAGFDESAGALFITGDALVLATDSRYELQAKKEASLYDIICYKTGLAKEIPSILRQLKTRRLGFEARRMPVDLYKKIKAEIKSENLPVALAEQTDLVEGLRVIKDDGEIEAIKKAVAVAEDGFESFLSLLKPVLTEADAAWALEKQIRSAGAQSLAFPVIAAFGPNSALPHAIPGDRLLEKGEPILFDWGARLKGYCSDMTRTLVFGEPDDYFHKIFTIVYDAQQKAVEAIRPGISSKKIDDIARSHIAAKGFKENFGHGLGHGAGLAVHEPPAISPLAEKEIVIKENMVFTVEPGIYIPDWGGIRLENLILVRKDGAEVLNRLNTRMALPVQP